jgi:hypothetical protein
MHVVQIIAEGPDEGTKKVLEYRVNALLPTGFDASITTTDYRKEYIDLEI